MRAPPSAWGQPIEKGGAKWYPKLSWHLNTSMTPCKPICISILA